MSTDATPTACALCGQHAPLIQSHLIPAFVIRAFKANTLTGFIRHAENPNRRREDGKKLPLLCAKCDNERFGAREGSFSKAVFAPWLRKSLTEFIVREDDLYFAASLTWRNLVYDLSLTEKELRDDGHTDEDIGTMRDAEAALRRYLVGHSVYPEQYQQHIIFSGLTLGTSASGLDAYLQATLEMYIPGRGDYLYSITNLSLGILIVCPLRTDDERLAEWATSGSHLTIGNVLKTSGQQIRDGYFGGLLALRPDQLEKYKNISAAQKAKIVASVAKADKTKWLTGFHGAAFQREFEKRQDSRRYSVSATKPDGEIDTTVVPHDRLMIDLREVPDIYSRLDDLAIGSGFRLVMLEDGMFVDIRRVA